MPYGFSIGENYFDRGHPLVIAEIGTGHGGELSKARELIEAAAASGALCAKFQCVFAEEIIHPNTGFVPLPGGKVALFDRFKALEEDEDFYAEIKAYAESRGLMFLCTPFGLRSAALLRRIGCRAMKIASPELNHFPLIEELASYGLPTILSSGVSTLSDIDRALRLFRSVPGAGAASLLHCVTSYPAPPEDYNLRLLPLLGDALGLPAGVSDHSMDPILIPALAVAVGACIVEKHICLSRGDPGLDDPIALPPDDFASMAKAVARAASLPQELTISEISEAYGPDLVEKALGDGVKRLAPSEEANYCRTNRSIHAMRDIKAGEVFSASDLALLRTEKVLKVGLDPAMMGVAIGRRALRDIASGQGLEWEDLGEPVVSVT